MLLHRPKLNDDSVVKIYTSHDILLLPVNVSEVQVYCLGGGSGGGGGGVGGLTSEMMVGCGGGGGAHGGYIYNEIDVKRGESLCITVGKGGWGGNGGTLHTPRGQDGQRGHPSKVGGSLSGLLIKNKNNPDGGSGGGSSKFISIIDAKGKDASVYYSRKGRRFQLGGDGGNVLFRAGSGGGGGVFPIRLDVPGIDYSGHPGNGGDGGDENSSGKRGGDATLFGTGGGGGGGASTLGEGKGGGNGGNGSPGYVVVIY